MYGRCMRRCSLYSARTMHPPAPQMSMDQVEEMWNQYTHLHVLHIGGIPTREEMKLLAPRLFQQYENYDRKVIPKKPWKKKYEAAAPGMHFVYNDDGVDPHIYMWDIKDRKGYWTYEKPHEPLLTACEIKVRRELWHEASQQLIKAKNYREDRFVVDTRGFSCHGIVPPPPNVEAE